MTERAAANVFATSFETCLSGETVRCTQLGTVMTAPQERGLGLSRFLLEQVIADCAAPDSILYLYGNDSVTEFYPRFGFSAEKEYQYASPVKPGKRTPLRRLSLRDAADRELFLKSVEKGNPFSAFPVRSCLEASAFHCLLDYAENVYWAEAFGAVVVQRQEGGHFPFWRYTADRIPR